MDPLQQLLIERECERLLIQSMWNTDFGVASHTADLFIPDGVMYVGPNTVRDHICSAIAGITLAEHTVDHTRTLCSSPEAKAPTA